MSANLTDSFSVIDRLVSNALEQSKSWIEISGALILPQEPYQCSRSEINGEVDLMIHAASSKDEYALWFSGENEEKEKEEKEKEEKGRWYFPPQQAMYDVKTGQRGVMTGFILPNGHFYHTHPYHNELMNSIDTSVSIAYEKMRDALQKQDLPLDLMQNMLRTFEALRIMCTTVVPSQEDIKTLQNFQKYGYPPASMRIASGYGITIFNSKEGWCVPVEKMEYELNMIKSLFEVVQRSFEIPFSSAELFVKDWFQRIEVATQLKLNFTSLKSYEAYCPWLVEKVRQKR